MIKGFRNRKFESAENNIFELWTDVLGFIEDEIGGLILVEPKNKSMNNIYVYVDQYNGNFAWRFEKKDTRIIVDISYLTRDEHERFIIETKKDLDAFKDYFD